ncbi:hypothetical protein BDR05DRAFT_740506 [Suillus weaverae]|nr:hypothetical protein BDR05DRAFT_740506 [Suillus weaverae]
MDGSLVPLSSSRSTGLALTPTEVTILEAYRRRNCLAVPRESRLIVLINNCRQKQTLPKASGSSTQPSSLITYFSALSCLIIYKWTTPCCRSPTLSAWRMLSRLEPSTQKLRHLHRLIEIKYAKLEPILQYLTVELPALDQQNDNIAAHGKRLTISGDFKRSDTMTRADIRCRNVRMASFIGHGDFIVQAGDVHAKMENGVFTETRR